MRALGWKPKLTIREGIARTLAYLEAESVPAGSPMSYRPLFPYLTAHNYGKIRVYEDYRGNSGWPVSEAKAYAARNGMPVREVFERGLRMVLEGSPSGRRHFRLKTVTTKGEGLVCDADWSAIRSGSTKATVDDRSGYQHSGVFGS